MAAPPDRLRDSPVDFETAVAYALHPEMRRLIILYIVGVIILPVGLEMFLTGGAFVTLPLDIIQRLIGLLLAIGGATLLFGGLVGTAFKLVTDANLLAMEQ